MRDSWGGRDAAAVSASYSSLSLSPNTTKMSAHGLLLQDERVGEDTLSHGEDSPSKRGSDVPRRAWVCGTSAALLLNGHVWLV